MPVHEGGHHPGPAQHLNTHVIPRRICEGSVFVFSAGEKADSLEIACLFNEFANQDTARSGTI
jgi:hypothetical protein